MIKKVVIGIIILVVVIGVIGALAGGDNNSSTNTTDTQQASNQEGSGQAEATMAKVGEAVQDDDLAFTVTNVETATTLGSSFTEKTAQGMFYVISLNIENKGKKTQTIDSSMISMTDSQGRTFERSIEGQTAKGMSQGKVDLFLQQVQPSLSVDGDIVFDVPQDATGLILIVKGGMFSSGKKIDLGK